MPDPKSTTSPPKPGGDDEMAALRDAVQAINRRLDAMGSKRDDDRRKSDDRRDDKRRPDDDRKRRDDDGAIGTHTTEELRAELARREEEEGETSAADDDDARMDKRRPDDGDKELLPVRTASDDDRRRSDRYRGDSADNKLGELQHEWDEVALMLLGERAWRPMDGEGPIAYDRKHAKRFQQYSRKWSGVDLGKLGARALAIAAPEIRQDAVRAANEPAPGAIPELREVRRTDRTGRNISRFIGPVSVCLEPFRYPTSRVRLNQPLIDATNFRLASMGR